MQCGRKPNRLGVVEGCLMRACQAATEVHMSERARRYLEACAALDFETLGKLRHADYTCTYPQSGERFRGHAKWVLAHADYASHFGEEHLVDVMVKGGRQKTEVSSAGSSPLPFLSAPIIQMSDKGDVVTLEASGRWPDGKTYHFVQILEYRDDLVWRETDYFAEPFAAPEWRAQFAERLDG